MWTNIFALWACILVHFSNNFVTLLLDFLPEANAFLSGTLTAAAFLLFPILLMRLLKKTRAVQLADTKHEKISFSPAMCICLGIFAAITIYETII